jgi:hypothetical protein
MTSYGATHSNDKSDESDKSQVDRGASKVESFGSCFASPPGVPFGLPEVLRKASETSDTNMSFSS